MVFILLVLLIEKNITVHAFSVSMPVFMIFFTRVVMPITHEKIQPCFYFFFLLTFCLTFDISIYFITLL